MQNTLYIVGGIAFILFFVGLGMSYRTWRIHTLILVLAVFSAAVVFCALLVQTVNMHRYWGEQASQIKKEIEQVQARNKLLEYGSEKGDKITTFGIKQLKERMVDVTRDRGRMWAGAQPQSVDPATGEVKVTVTTPKEHQIKPKMLLYAFEERPAGTSSAYLGEFRVTSVSGGEGPAEEPAAEEKPAEGDKADADKPAEAKQPAPKPEGAGGDSIVTLQPAWRISPSELSRVKNSAGPWVLHDKMPPDNHESLVKVHVDPLTDAPLIDPKSGKPVDRIEQIKSLVPPSVAAEYIKDFQPAEKDDPPQRVAVLVQFVKNYKLPVAQAVAPAAAAGNEAAPGGAGFGGAPAAGAPAAAAAPAAPQESFEFQKDAQAYVLEPLAKELVESQTAKIVKPEKRRYERELRDYAKLFDSYYLERMDMANEIQNLERQNTAIIGVHAKNVELIESVAAEQGRLAHDLKQYQFESAALAKHLTALKQQYQELAQQIRALFAANLQMAAKLESQQRAAAASINRRAPAAPQAIDISK